MYYLSYVESEYSDGTGKTKRQIREYDDMETLNKKKASLSGVLQYSNIMILVNVENQIDYKQKFEELYNHLLISSGIRKSNAFEQSNEAVIVHESQN